MPVLRLLPLLVPLVSQVWLLIAIAIASSSSTVTGGVFVAAIATSSSVFVGPSGVLLSSPLSLEGTDVGSTMTHLADRIDQLTATVAAHEKRIASLEADLTATNAVVAAQEQAIAALTAEVDSINSTVTDISDLTGETTIVVVVNGLRRLTSQLSTDLTVIDGTVANQTAAIASLTSDLSDVESLTGDSTLVSTVTALSSSLAALTSTVDGIADLTGSSTIVSTVESIIDSMTDQATEIATLQTLETATTQMLTTLSQTVSSQVTLLTGDIAAVDTALEKQLAQVNSTLRASIVTLQARATTDEASITALQTLTANHTSEIAALQAANSLSRLTWTYGSSANYGDGCQTSATKKGYIALGWVVTGSDACTEDDTYCTPDHVRCYAIMLG